MQFWQTLLGVVIGGGLTFVGGYVQQWQQRRKEFNRVRLERIRTHYAVLLNNTLLISRLYRNRANGEPITNTMVAQAQTIHDEAEILAGQVYLEEPTDKHKDVIALVIKFHGITSQTGWRQANKETADQLSSIINQMISVMQEYIRMLEKYSH